MIMDCGTNNFLGDEHQDRKFYDLLHSFKRTVFNILRGETLVEASGIEYSFGDHLAAMNQFPALQQHRNILGATRPSQDNDRMMKAILDMLRSDRIDEYFFSLQGTIVQLPAPNPVLQRLELLIIFLSKLQEVFELMDGIITHHHHAQIVDLQLFFAANSFTNENLFHYDQFIRTLTALADLTENHHQLNLKNATLIHHEGLKHFLSAGGAPTIAEVLTLLRQLHNGGVQFFHGAYGDCVLQLEANPAADIVNIQDLL